MGQQDLHMDAEYMNGRWTGSGMDMGARTRINSDDPSALGVGHSRKGSSIFPALRKLAAPIDVRTFIQSAHTRARRRRHGDGHGDIETEQVLQPAEWRRTVLTVKQS